jgi:hypothetical protein
MECVNGVIYCRYYLEPPAWKDVEEVVVTYFKVVSRHSSQGTEENHENPVIIVGDPVEIRTIFLSNTYETFHRLSSLSVRVWRPLTNFMKQCPWEASSHSASQKVHPHFMNSEALLTPSQGSANGHCSEPDEFSPHCSILFPQSPF